MVFREGEIKICEGENLFCEGVFKKRLEVFFKTGTSFGIFITNH